MKEKFPTLRELQNTGKENIAEKAEGPSGQRIIELVNKKTKERTGEPKEKIERWKKLRDKIFRTSLAGMVFLGSYFADYKKVAAEELVKERPAATMLVEKNKFKEIFPDINPNINKHNKQENLTEDDYWFILTTHFNKQGMTEVLKRLRSVKINKTNGEKVPIHEEYGIKGAEMGHVEGYGTKQCCSLIIQDYAIEENNTFAETKIFLHELGHILDPRNPGLPEKPNFWEKVRKQSKKEISHYAKEIQSAGGREEMIPIEDFADTFTDYLMHPRYLVNADSVRFMAMHNYITELNKSRGQNSIFDRSDQVGEFLIKKGGLYVHKRPNDEEIPSVPLPREW